MTDLAWLPLAEASRLIRARELSPVEYANALLARISAYDEALDSVILPLPEIALAAAKQAESEIAAGNWRGPLHGIPFGLKDIVDLAGVPTTAQSRVLLDNVPTEDAVVTERLKAAGAVPLAKLATWEFACSGPIWDSAFPPARNPWDRERTPGGSSSGSGSAVAAGFVPMAIGTDTGGSIRNPAASCGIVGMKATYGRVSRRGVVPLGFSLDHVGPMTRTVEDNALMLSVLAGHDPGDPGSADEPVADYAAGLRKGVKGLKIGHIRHFYTQDYVASAEVVSVIETALEILAKLGAEIVEIQAPPLKEFADCLKPINRAEAYAIHEKWLQERPEDYGARTRERLMVGAGTRAVDYVQATRQRARLQARFAAAMADVDIALTAVTFGTAPRFDDAEGMIRTYTLEGRPPFNITGSPAMVQQAGFGADGMPLAIQLVGKPFAEAMVYRVAHAFEQATDWHNKHPVLQPAAKAFAKAAA